MLVKYAVENEKLKTKLDNIHRLNLLHDQRVSYHADDRNFEKYTKRFMHTIEDKPADSAGAAKDILARGIAHGRKRKNNKDSIRPNK